MTVVGSGPFWEGFLGINIYSLYLLLIQFRLLHRLLLLPSFSLSNSLSLFLSQPLSVSFSLSPYPYSLVLGFSFHSPRVSSVTKTVRTDLR